METVSSCVARTVVEGYVRSLWVACDAVDTINNAMYMFMLMYRRLTSFAFLYYTKYGLRKL